MHVAAGREVAPGGAEDHGGPGVDLYGRQRGEQAVGGRGGDQAEQERDAPGGVVFRPLQQAAKDAADAGNAPVEQQEKRCGQSD